jgi:SAM-dependent methyltransferase
VVDLGCGYWAFNELIEWHGAHYTGIDVVEAVIADNMRTSLATGRQFITADIRTCDIPACDLLIIKDVLIHWTNAEVTAFLNRKIPAKHILITNDDRVAELNTDISAPGEFRDIDITKAPFNAKASVVLKWEYPHKSTWALTKRSNGRSRIRV